jgi:predicted DCC family thiol-disulfide oxidoreductase YuxK
LIAIQVALVYLYTFAWKALGPMWLSGIAVYYTSRLVEFWRFPVPYVFEHLATIKLWTWGTLLVEFALGVLVWVKELRYWVLLSGVLLHLGIDYSMNIPLFAPIMISSYLTFVDPEDLERFFARIRRWFAPLIGREAEVPVLYDGKCSFCIRSVEVLSSLDIFRRLKLVDNRAAENKKLFPGFDKERADRELLVRKNGGGWLGGFDACRFLARYLPLLWPVLPLLYLPGAAVMGRKIYAKVAGNRYCIVPSAEKPQPAGKA